MQINGVNGPGNVSNIQRVQGPQVGTGEKSLDAAKSVPQAKDTLDISQSQNAQQSGSVSMGEKPVDGIRHELVNRVRAEIMAGTYDTDEKMDIALSRLLDELEGR